MEHVYRVGDLVKVIAEYPIGYSGQEFIITQIFDVRHGKKTYSSTGLPCFRSEDLQPVFKVGDLVKIHKPDPSKKITYPAPWHMTGWTIDGAMDKYDNFVGRITGKASWGNDFKVEDGGNWWFNEAWLEFAYEEEKTKMKKEARFKVGDLVKVKKEIKHVNTGKVLWMGCMDEYKGKTTKVTKVDTDGTYHLDGCWTWWFDDEWLEKVENKVLIMVDEKDPRKVVARNTVTGEKAEAKCAPDDTFDFNKGAKLAFDRLMEKMEGAPQEKKEAKKEWRGKVVCVKAEGKTPAGQLVSDYFTVGKVYEVRELPLHHWKVTDNTYSPWQFGPYEKIYSVDDLSQIFHKEWLEASDGHVEFIEYKGGTNE